jgi:hypothetical protein
LRSIERPPTGIFSRCAAVAAVVLGDATRAEEVREELQKELEA